MDLRAQYLVGILGRIYVGDGNGRLLICTPVDGVFKGAAFGVGPRIVQLVADLLEQFQTYDRATKPAVTRASNIIGPHFLSIVFFLFARKDSIRGTLC